MSTGLRITQVVLLLIGVMTLYGCGSADNTDNNNNNMAEQNLSSTNNISNQEDNIRKNEYSGDNMQSDKDSNNKYTKDTRVIDVINDEAFGNYGRLIFPVDMRISNDLTLENISSILPWYSEINTDKTVEIVNYLRNEAESGRQIFYDIYSDSEKADDPEKQNTGIFFFKGNDNAKSAVVNAGDGFVYVAGIHDSFPHALELSKKGYNAFALIYRPGAQTACEDLARAIAFLYEHSAELNIDMTDYSLWGGSAGARMAAWLGSYGTSTFGEKTYPNPASVIMQYTGLSQVQGNEPPTYACVGTSDGIASYRSMERYINQIKRNGTNAEIEVFNGLSHGFGLGQGTVAEGWINNAVSFWESNMKGIIK